MECPDNCVDGAGQHGREMVHGEQATAVTDGCHDHADGGGEHTLCGPDGLADCFDDGTYGHLNTDGSLQEKHWPPDDGSMQILLDTNDVQYVIMSLSWQQHPTYGCWGWSRPTTWGQPPARLYSLYCCRWHRGLCFGSVGQRSPRDFTRYSHRPRDAGSDTRQPPLSGTVSRHRINTAAPCLTLTTHQPT